jgi:peptidoglycan/LPS O-acetylase OafA/YrhL
MSSLVMDRGAGRDAPKTWRWRLGVFTGCAIAFFLIASLRVPWAYWSSPFGHFELTAMFGMALAVALGQRRRTRVRPAFRWLAGFVALAMLPGVALVLHDGLTTPEPEGSLVLVNYFGLITALFAYAAIRGRNWF